jgi:putative ABC transport system permease protein
MLRNYLKIAHRSLLRHKGFSLINISGLAIGMAACLFILQYASFELSFDDFHSNAQHIYRLVASDHDGTTHQRPLVPPPIGPGLRQHFPEVVQYARLILPWSGQAAPSTLGRQDNRGNPVLQTFQWGFYTDQGFLEMFSFPWIAGDRQRALQGTDKVVLAESAARKLFGNDWSEDQVLGTVLEYTNQYDRFQLVITGIIADAPANSHLQFDFFASFGTLSTGWANGYAEEWHGNGTYTYVHLTPGADTGLFTKKVNDYITEHGLPEQSANTDYFLQPLQDIHLHSNLEEELKVNGNATHITFLLIIAALILLVALVNYINLTTARSVARGSETGIRKVMGALRYQLIRQYLFESLLLNGLAFLLAIALFQAATPFYVYLTGKPLHMDNGIFWSFILLLFPLSTIISGLYPAFVLSGYDPVQVLKGRLVYSARGKQLRRGMVVFQFVVSMVLIIFTFAVSHQLRYMRSQDPGFDREAVVVVRGPVNRTETWIEHDKKRNEKNNTHDIFKESVSRYGGVKSVSLSWSVPGERSSIWYIELGETDDHERIDELKTDNDFGEVYGLELLAGRFDTSDGLVINESAARTLGFDTPEAAVGQVFPDNYNYERKINGVIRDYHHHSLHTRIRPLMFTQDDLSYKLDSYYSIKIDTRDLPVLLDQIEASYKKAYPSNPFTQYFISDYFDAQYRDDQRFGRLFSIFSSVTIFITCLGLFGLSLHTVIEKTKEIGVRKVLGAPVMHIVALLTAGNLKLVGLACIAALPLSYWCTEAWLSLYAFRVNQEWWLFAIPILIVPLIVLLTVGFHTMHAALANPVKSLRYE